MTYLSENYPGMQAENHCPLCSSSSGVEKFMDSQEHLLVCSKLKGESEVMEEYLEHDDIHSENLNVQTKITLILEAKYNERKKLIENMQKK